MPRCHGESVAPAALAAMSETWKGNFWPMGHQLVVP